MAAANKTPGLQAVFTTFTANTPQVFVDMDRVRAQMLMCRFRTSSTRCAFISAPPTSMISTHFGRTYRVTAQADGPYRIDQARIRS